MTIRTLVRLAASCICVGSLAACGGAGHVTPIAQSPVAMQPDQTMGGIRTMSMAEPPATSFLPSSWGKIGTFQIFDETKNGTISTAAAEKDGYRYSMVWGARPELAKAWQISNAGLKSSYYFIAVTDASTSSWGGIGHSLSWWKANHPTWILYACNASNEPTHTPASVVGLSNVPLDIHNPAVAGYLIPLVAGYAKRVGYSALAADEVTYWFSGSGGTGYHPCGIWSGSTFIRRYSLTHLPDDPQYITDILNFIHSAHTILRAQYPGIKLIINHPLTGLSGDEETMLANVDGDMDEGGFTDYGEFISTDGFANKIAEMRYAQEHGVAVFMNQDWGSASDVTKPQIDFSVATYLLGNEQSSAAFISAHNGYGIEVWRPEYATDIGAPCAEATGGPTIYYRRFANAVVVANAGTAAARIALPTGHTYVDLEGQAVNLTLAAHNGYVLKTTDGCN
jgi:hypothetical protein